MKPTKIAITYRDKVYFLDRVTAESKHYQIGSIMQTGQSLGMQLLEADLVRLYRLGMVSREEIFQRSQEHQLLTQFLNRG